MSDAPSTSANWLLKSLPRSDRAALEDAMQTEHPSRGKVLAGEHTRDDNVWFPLNAVVSLSATDEEGQSAQTGVVGPEGCVGLGALLEEAPPLADASVQIEGTFSVIPARRLRPLLHSRPAIRTALLRYLYRLTAQSLRVTACNRLHRLDQRCCTWLLMMQDRTHLDALPLTQDGLAAVLGGGRPRINHTLAGLERKGLVARRRGRIHLLNRRGLERGACDCYRTAFRI